MGVYRTKKKPKNRILGMYTLHSLRYTLFTDYCCTLIYFFSSMDHVVEIIKNFPLVVENFVAPYKIKVFSL